MKKLNPEDIKKAEKYLEELKRVNKQDTLKLPGCTCCPIHGKKRSLIDFLDNKVYMR